MMKRRVTVHRRAERLAAQTARPAELVAVVTTAILWFAGIALVVAASSRQRFDRLLQAASAAPTAQDRRADGHGPAHPFVALSRVAILAVGGLCLVLAVLGTWSSFG